MWPLKNIVRQPSNATTSMQDALLWASPELREDKEVLLSAVKNAGRALRYTDKLREDTTIEGLGTLDVKSVALA